MFHKICRSFFDLPRGEGSARMLAVAIAASLAAAPAIAQDTSPLCHKNTAADWPAQATNLVGIWTITHLGGWAEAAGMVIPFPADPSPEEVSFLMIGGDLLIDHPEAQAPILLRRATEPRWETSDRLTGAKAPISPDDAAMAVSGCDQTALQRLIGTTEATVDGQKMFFTFRLMLMTENDLYGGMQVDAMTPDGPVIARRAISLTRN